VTLQEKTATKDLDTLEELVKGKITSNSIMR